jgi:hypothetical protein
LLISSAKIVPKDEFNNAVRVFEATMTKEQIKDVTAMIKDQKVLKQFKNDIGFDYVLVDRLYKTSSDNPELLMTCCRILR